MTDPIDPKAMFVDSYATATKTMQAFASEMQKASKESMDKTTELVETLRGAKTMEEVMSIQAAFMQQSLTTYADVTRRFSELMLAIPMEVAKHGRAAFQQSVDAMTNAAPKAND